ncbi:hypothetical protein LP420_37660 [Massilia sp. B-10]|nr:hypothetical protein LP420_37660 [Massilia sp. B-10]
MSRVLALLGRRLVLAQQPKQLLLFFLVRLQRVELVGDDRLRLEFLEVGVQFAQDVFHAQQVLRVSLRRFSVLRFGCSLYLETPAASSRNTRSSSGRDLDDARDHALADDRVGARSQAGAEEDVLDVVQRTGWPLM